MQHKIGYIGSDEDYEVALSGHFENLGYSFVSFKTLDEVFRSDGGSVPDIFVVNSVFEGEKMSEAFFALKENEATSRIPVVFLVDEIVFPDDTADEVGGFDFVSVPCYPEEILVRINTLLRMARLSSEVDDKNRSLESLIESLQQKNQEIESLLSETNALNERLGELAIRDELTGIYNKRYLMEKMEGEFSRAVRYSYPLGFLMADLDHFKDVNDTYGHQVGDEVLKLVSKTLADTVRTDDTVTRYGGEEIGIILPFTSSVFSMRAAERLRKCVERATSESGLIHGSVTISIGGASTDSGNVESPADLIRLADKMLYEAKKHGRNCSRVLHVELEQSNCPG